MCMISKQSENDALKDSLQGRPAEGTVVLWWLGQAGFAIKYQETLVLIDPYLSDFLAKKYAGKFFTHRRMMPPPILPQDVERLDLLLCTHRHSDHIDPETAPVLAQNNPKSTVVVPKAAGEWGLEIGIPKPQLRVIDAGERLELGNGIRVAALPSAHESFETNERGEHLFLGYILRIGELTLYHSGDCVPYPGLAESLKSHSIDLALLPINGRDEYRQSHGVPGNFTLQEAVSLCKEAQIPNLICHHFGMFDFNTVNVEEAEKELQHIRGDKNYFLADRGTKYTMSQSL